MVEKITNIKENKKYNKRNIQEYANNKLEQHIDNLQSYLDEFKEIKNSLENLKMDADIYRHFRGMVENIESKQIALRDLKALRKVSNKLSLFKEYYITDNIYFVLWLNNLNPAHEYEIVGRFYVDGEAMNDLYENVYSSVTGLNDMFNTVLTGILSILLQDKYLINMSWTLGNEKRNVECLLNDLIDLSSKLEEIFENKNSWQFKLLQDTANNIVKNILEHAEEYDD